MLHRLVFIVVVHCIREHVAVALSGGLGNGERAGGHRRDFLSSRSMDARTLVDDEVVKASSGAHAPVNGPVDKTSSKGEEEERGHAAVGKGYSLLESKLKRALASDAGLHRSHEFSASSKTEAGSAGASPSEGGAMSSDVSDSSDETPGGVTSAGSQFLDPVEHDSRSENLLPSQTGELSDHGLENSDDTQAAAARFSQGTNVSVTALTGYAKVISDHMHDAEQTARLAADTIGKAAAAREEYETARAEAVEHAGEARDAARAVLSHMGKAREVSNLTVDAILDRLGGGSGMVDVNDAVQNVKSDSQDAIGATERSAAAVDAYKAAAERARRAAEESWELHQSVAARINATINSSKLAADALGAPYLVAKEAVTNITNAGISDGLSAASPTILGSKSAEILEAATSMEAALMEVKRHTLLASKATRERPDDVEPEQTSDQPGRRSASASPAGGPSGLSELSSDAHLDPVTAASAGYATVISEHMHDAEQSARLAADTIAKAAAAREEYETARAQAVEYAGEARDAAHAVLTHSSQAHGVSNLTVDSILDRLGGGSGAVDIDYGVREVKSASQDAIGATERSAAAVYAYNAAMERARQAAESSWELHRSVAAYINATINSAMLAGESLDAPFEFAREAVTNAKIDIISDGLSGASVTLRDSIDSVESIGSIDKVDTGALSAAPLSWDSAHLSDSQEVARAEAPGQVSEDESSALTDDAAKSSLDESVEDSVMNYLYPAAEYGSSAGSSSGRPSVVVVKTDAVPTSPPSCATLNLLLCLVIFTSCASVITCWFSGAVRQRSE